MLDKMIGFIGAGNMGSAMIGGILDASLVTTSQIIASAHSPETLDKIRTKFSIETTQSNEVVAERSDILFLAVKPNKFSEVLPQIKGHLKPDCIVVSIAAGQPIANIEALLGEVRLIRAMPNTPLLLGEGATALCQCPPATDGEFALVRRIFEAAGVVEVLPESLMNEVIAVNGSSPAYVYLFAKAVMDSAAKTGIPAEQAKKLFVQTLIGSAKMLTDSGMEPQQLIDMVSSKGGTTIAALERFRAHGFEEMVDDAMSACTRRALELGK